jgi:hypothetical protein
MIIFPAHLAVDATSALARSALPDAPVEPDHVRRRPRPVAFLRALLAKATIATKSRGRLQANRATR